MIDVVNARIKAFGTSPQADFVPQSEESVFILTSSQLQDLLKEAIQPLQDRVETQDARIAAQDEKIAALESTQETQADNQLIQLRLIGQLREAIKKVPGKTEASRAEKIEKYLVSRPDHRATYDTLKGYLGVDKARLHEAIKTLMDASPGQYGIVRVLGDKRKRVLVMLLK